MTESVRGVPKSFWEMFGKLMDTAGPFFDSFIYLSDEGQRKAIKAEVLARAEAYSRRHNISIKNDTWLKTLGLAAEEGVITEAEAAYLKLKSWSSVLNLAFGAALSDY